MAERDDVAKELLQIIEDCKNHNFNIDEDLLMQKLCSFIVRRDSKLWNHAYNLGKKKNEETQDNQKEK